MGCCGAVSDNVQYLINWAFFLFTGFRRGNFGVFGVEMLIYGDIVAD